MDVIKIKVDNKHLKLIEIVKHVMSGTRGLLSIEFEFSKEWDEFTKTAVIYANEYSPETAAAIIIDENNMITADKFPSQLIAKKCDLFIGVFGDNALGQRPVTSQVCLHINEGTPTDGVEMQVDTSLYNQIIEIMTTTKSIAEDVKKRADDGEFDGADGKDGKDGSDYILTEADKKEIASMVEVEGGGYSRTEIDTKLGTKITLYTGTTAPISSPSAYPDFVEPSLYFDKSTKKLYTLFSAGSSSIVPYEHLSRVDLNNMTKTYTGTGAPSNKYSDYPNAKVGDIYIDTNDYNKFYSVMLITESVNYIYWSPCAREGLLVGNYVSYSTLTNGYYNKPQVDQKINEIKVAQIVNELPEVGLEGVLYCVPKNEPNSNDLYDDYKYINGAWELIGTRQITIDLSNYPTFDDMNTAIENSIGNINTVLASLVDVESEVVE